MGITKESSITKKWREDFKNRDPEGYKRYRQEEGRKRYEKNKEQLNRKAVEWAKRNPDKVREIKRKHRRKLTPEENATATLKSKYGITFEQKLGLLAAQDNRCAICGDDDPPMTKVGTTGWTVDHCHAYERETGGIKIRGILCISCNTLLGMAKDKTEILLAAVQYLNKHK